LSAEESPVIFKAMIKGIAFDLDGTLTRPCIDFRGIRNRIGGLEPNLPIYEQALKLPALEKARAMAILEEVEMECAGRAEPNPEVYELIQYLEARGIRKAIFTRNARRALDLTLSLLGLSGRFDPMITRELGLKLKPDPESILYILRHWQLAPEQVLVVGDFAFDLVAGNRAGCRTIYLNHQAGAGPGIPADFLISRLDEIIKIMEGLNEAGSDQG